MEWLFSLELRRLLVCRHYSCFLRLHDDFPYILCQPPDFGRPRPSIKFAPTSLGSSESPTPEHNHTSDQSPPLSDEKERVTIDSLPPEVLWSIFKLLGSPPTLAEVDKKWQAIYAWNFKVDMSKKEVDKFFSERSDSELHAFLGCLERSYRLRGPKVLSRPKLAGLLFARAAEFGHLSLVRVMASQGVDPRAKDNWAIRMASQNGHRHVVRFLLGLKRVDPSAEDNYATRFACSNGHLGVVRMLLADHRCNPADQDNEALMWATWNGHDRVVKKLLACSTVDFLSKVATLRIAMHNAETCRSQYNSKLDNYTEIICCLLGDLKVLWIAEDVLSWACEHGHASVVRFLLRNRRVDPYYSQQSLSLLLSARRNGHDDIVSMLLQDEIVSKLFCGSKNIHSRGQERIVQTPDQSSRPSPRSARPPREFQPKPTKLPRSRPSRTGQAYKTWCR